MSDLFDFDEKENFISPKLTVVKADFIEAESKDWQELFDGFDEMYAITYSNGMKFTCELLSKFKHAEVIFGCENVIGSDISTLLAHQLTTLNFTLRSKSIKSLAERIENKEINLFVSRDLKSHEKIFILKSETGNTRVICGSANMSYSAFEGVQRENVVYFDDKNAFNFYLEQFNLFKEKCSDNMTETISARLLRKDESPVDVEEIPFCKTVKANSVVVLQKDNDADNIEYITNVNQLSKELKPVIPKLEEKGSVVITGESIRTIKRKYQSVIQEKEKNQKIRPVFHIDFENRLLSLNGKPISLETNQKGIESDIKCLIQYFTSLKIFAGTPEEIMQTQIDFFKFMNWFFASVFCPKLRYVANQNEYDINKFPVYGILYGQSNGGKSTFIEFLTKLMSGKKDSICSSSDFTKTNIETLKFLGEGVPINIDDLAKDQYDAHYEKIIKNDWFGIAEEKINYPAVTITANKIPALKPDIIKRVVACRIDTRIDRVVASNNHKMVRDCIKQASNSFYNEYLLRMFGKVEELEEKMKSSAEQFTPDIFEISSQVLLGILSEYCKDTVPEYFSIVNWEDYLGEKATSKNATKKIKDEWFHNRKVFKIDRQKNELIYTIPEKGNYFELGYIADELPAYLRAYKTQRSLIMNLDAAKKHFEIDFKKGLF